MEAENASHNNFSFEPQTLWLVYDKEKEKNRRVLDQHLQEISSRDINNVIKLLLVQTVGI